jgi:O-succinylhomoserine sulfhydrylase
MKRFETLAIRTQTDRSQHKEHSTPIFPTSSFIFDTAEEMRAVFAEELSGNVYSRYSNPSVREFELKMALLENSEEALATASGMSAIFTTFACLLSKGDHVVLSQAVFGSTIKVMENFFNKWGVEHTMVIGNDLNKWESSFKTNTKFVYLESPSNPGLEIYDIYAIAKLCKTKNALFIIDNCFATPYLQRPIDLGADISIHSATKYIDGQGRVLGGVICSTKDIITSMLPFIRNAGPTLSPFNAWVLSKSLETLAVRMDRHCQNALSLAEMLINHPAIKRVRYPFLSSHPSYEIARSQMKAGGGIVSLDLHGDISQSKKFIDGIKMLSISPNLGDTRTIVTHPASSTHSRLSEEQRLSIGITPSLIRISVGLEHIDDIADDIIHSLDKLN